MIGRAPFWTKKWVILGMSAGIATGGFTVYNLITPAFATDLELHCPKLPWTFNKPFRTYEHASIRRGFQVYREVCSQCHSLKFIYFRHLVNVCFTEEEVKKIASEYMIQDGPNDQGEMFERPGKLSDRIPSPYPNDAAGRLANNGALPPDLSYIAKGRHDTEDYLFHLLTGYCEAPPGKVLADGQYYNPYFPGGGIGMAQALWNDLIQYEDGTPASISQMAKDVAVFLSWSADPHRDARERMLIKYGFILVTGASIAYYAKRFKWSTIKARKLAYKNRPPPKIF
jgi:ubiquinol-cytochrome c reductase cytochrome c1 subunit